MIAEEAGSFVIRDTAPLQKTGALPPVATIPLGASVHIDRAALQPIHEKDIDHGDMH